MLAVRLGATGRIQPPKGMNEERNGQTYGTEDGKLDEISHDKSTITFFDSR
jgi:hypothetical protein